MKSTAGLDGGSDGGGGGSGGADGGCGSCGGSDGNGGGGALGDGRLGDGSEETAKQVITTFPRRISPLWLLPETVSKLRPRGVARMGADEREQGVIGV